MNRVLNRTVAGRILYAHMLIAVYRICLASVRGRLTCPANAAIPRRVSRLRVFQNARGADLSCETRGPCPLLRLPCTWGGRRECAECDASAGPFARKHNLE